MTVVFVNRFFYPDHSATSQMLSDLAFALAARGHGVEVITSRLSYEGSHKLKRRETVRGVRIVRLPTTAFGRGRLLGRAIDYLTFYGAAFFSLCWRVRRGSVVVAKTDPPLLSLITAPACALKGALTVNWLQDIFPEVALALGLGRGRVQGAGLSLLRRLRNLTLRKASLNVVLGEDMAAKLRQLGVPARQIRIIPNWAHGGCIRPVAPEENSLRKEWGLENAFVIGYSGNLGRAHEIGTFLAGIAALEAQAPAPIPAAYFMASEEAGTRSLRSFRWLFVGGGAQMDALKREVTKRELKSVMFRPYQPRERLSESLSLPDVHLISLRSGLEGLIVPSKYYGIAAAGRPAIFVGHPGGEIARILERSESDFAVSEGDGAGLVEAILALAGNPELAASQGKIARQLFEAKFDFPIALQAWERTLEEVRLGTSCNPSLDG